MKEVDALVVGFGLAGLAYVETLRQNKTTFHVIDQSNSGSSEIAAGIYNPTVLKRFNMTWKGEELHRFSLPFYREIAHRLSIKIDYPSPVYKLFNEKAEHNQWSVAADRSGLSNFLVPEINLAPIPGVKVPHGYGQLMDCGRIDTAAMLVRYKKSIRAHFTETRFDFTSLKHFDAGVQYKDIKANYVVFCEGYAMVKNPYFKNLPLVGSKGQILIINAPELKSKAILKGPIFIAPLGNNLYWAGASFEQHDKTMNPTDKGKEWILSKIDKMISVPYTVHKHITHIRPTVVDRRPLLGQHQIHKNLFLFNGLGSRGVLTAPLAAKWLYNSIENNISLIEEVDIKRFLETT